MGYLDMTLSNEDATAISDRIEAIAKNLKSSSLVEPVEPRTLAQLRADAVTDLLLHGVTETGLGAGIRANVYVSVPVLTLMGKSDEPVTLEGCGPIDPEIARNLAGTATSFTRILVHPVFRQALQPGSRALLRTHQIQSPRGAHDLAQPSRRGFDKLDQRNGGCNRRAMDCDLDNTLATEWAYARRYTSNNERVEALAPGLNF